MHQHSAKAYLHFPVVIAADYSNQDVRNNAVPMCYQQLMQYYSGQLTNIPY